MKHLPFVCSCLQGNSKITDLRAWADQHFAKTPGRVTQAVMELQWNHDASIVSLGCDMWFGISVERDGQTFRVECDELEDGFAALLRYFEQNYTSRDEVRY